MLILVSSILQESVQHYFYTAQFGCIKTGDFNKRGSDAPRLSLLTILERVLSSACGAESSRQRVSVSAVPVQTSAGTLCRFYVDMNGKLSPNHGIKRDL